MPVDTSMYNTAPPQPVNPLAMVGQVANTQNALNQNRLFQQDFAARKAYGDIIQQSTDPTTGVTDYSKANGLAAGNPATAFKAPEFAQQAIERQQAQTTLDKTQLDLATSHLNNVLSTWSTLANKPDLSIKDFTSAAGDLIANKITTPQIAVNELSQIPPNATPQQLQQIAKQYALRAMDAQQRVQAMYGSPQMINNGSGQQIVAASPMMGTTTAISPVIPNQLSPGENAARIPTFNNGQPGSVPQSTLVDPTGHAQGGQPAASGGSPLGTGHYPAQGAPAASAVAPGSPAGFVASGPKLGAEGAANVTATASANQGVNLQQTADQVPQRKALLGNLEAALNNFTSGPLADWKKVGESLTNAANPFGDINLKGIASQEEFAKQATQLAQSQFQALGGTGTDAKLDSAMHTSPNTALSPMGNKGIINMLKGNEDAISVKNAEWQDYLAKGHSPQDYGGFSKEFNTHFDPRVFQSVYMTPEQRQDLLKGLDKSEKSQFQQTYNYAVQRGWIPDPRSANAAQ